MPRRSLGTREMQREPEGLAVKLELSRDPRACSQSLAALGYLLSPLRGYKFPLVSSRSLGTHCLGRLCLPSGPVGDDIELFEAEPRDWRAHAEPGHEGIK